MNPIQFSRKLNALLWNLEWASTRSKRYPYILNIRHSIDPDVICFTETYPDLMPEEGFTITSDEDYGYKAQSGRRKVLLWSKYNWTDIETFGDAKLPSGRFVSGITQGIRFIGVCIPWKDAHVRSGRKDKEPWEDHLAYLSGLRKILDKYRSSEIPLCLLGDFNQRIPRSRQPNEVYTLLMTLLQDDFDLITSNTRDLEGNLLIDHIACSNGIEGKLNKLISRTTSEGMQLSDHTGIVADLIFPSNNLSKS